MLYVAGRPRAPCSTARPNPVVAIVGSERPTDYGMEMARSLARGLAASRVTVLSASPTGSPRPRTRSAGGRGPTVTVMAGGVDVVEPAGRRELYERVLASGCAIAEAPCGCTAALERIGRARTVAALAAVTIVVEADEGPRAARRPDRPCAGADGRGHPGSGHFAGEPGNERAADGRCAAGARTGRCTRPAVWAGRLGARSFVADDTSCALHCERRSNGWAPAGTRPAS